MPLLETTDNQIKIPQPRLDYHFGVVSHRGSINFHYSQTIAIVEFQSLWATATVLDVSQGT